MSQDRTEAATPQRLHELREQGRVPRSTDLQIAASLLAGLVTLRAFGPPAVGRLRELASSSLSTITPGDLSAGHLQALGSSWAGELAQVTLPLVLPLAAVGATAGLLQTGFVLATGAIAPDFGRVNPMRGWGRIFSLQSPVELAKTLTKVAIITLLGWRLLQDRLDQLLALSRISLTDGAAVVSGVILDLATQSAVLVLAMAGLDYGYQRWHFARQTRMSKEDVKQSNRQSEGDPQIRERMRSLSRRYARGRMLQAVPRAAVVITNPVHLAVAIAYEPGQQTAPRIVAKGERLLAQRIKAIAAEHGVPVVTNPPLAWALHRGAEIGDLIPSALYEAIAQVLAYVYSLRTPRLPGGPTGATRNRE